MAKAYLISPQNQTIDPIEIDDFEHIKTLIGFDTIETDSIGEAGDTLYFDEECFIRGTTGRFQIDSLIPVAGAGIVVGGEQENLADVQISLDELLKRSKFL